MCGELHLVSLEKNKIEDGCYLRCEGEKSSSYSKFICEKVWLYFRIRLEFLVTIVLHLEFFR
jgi:hypothetical protein